MTDFLSVIMPWLGSVFWNITFIPLSDEDVKELRLILASGTDAVQDEQ
jgi:hypothetical protein